MVWVESPTNPSMKLVDIRKLGDILKAKHPDVIFVVDNTFLSPYFQVRYRYDSSSFNHYSKPVLICDVVQHVLRSISKLFLKIIQIKTNEAKCQDFRNTFSLKKC